MRPLYLKSALKAHQQNTLNGAIFVLALGTSLAASFATAQSVVYKCEMPDGSVQFSDVDRPNCKALGLPGYVSKPPLGPAKDSTPKPALPSVKHKGLTIADAKQILEEHLRDPEATRYKDVFVTKSGNVCGRVNGKNAYGGYVGYTPFYVVADARYAVVVPHPPESVHHSGYREACGRELP